MAKKDYYEVLGVPKNVGADELKQAYRKQALKYHPDKNRGNPQAEDKFKEATEAYDVLGDPQKRANYDRFGHEGVSGMGGFGRGTADYSDIFGDFGGFDDIFESFFGGGFAGSRGRSQRPRRGADLQYDLQITLEEAALGKEAHIEIPRREVCETCHGTGAKAGTQPVTCTTCHGAGQIRQTQGFFSITQPCPKCHGSGKIITSPCAVCHGTGLQVKKRNISVKVIAGVESGSRLKISGEGEQSPSGGTRGDLYVVIHVKKHDVFERHGNDVINLVNISFPMACLGGEIEVATISGSKAKMKIPAGTENGQVFRLKGNGIPYLGSYGRGDQLVKINVSVPKKLSQKQKDLLGEFANTLGE